MGIKSVVDTVSEVVKPVLAEDDLELVDVEYKKEGPRWFLRVFIDKIGGITVKDCQKISRKVEDIIEIEDIIDGKYFLEVSSPGLDRPLKSEKDLLRNLNKRVSVDTRSSINKKCKFVGTVQNAEDGLLFLKLDDEVLSIPIDEIKKATLEIKF
jgi:ribosome maturation factor RimP